MKKFDLLATTLHGLEAVLADELKALGATDITILTRAVSFKGDLALLYKTNLHLRTAIRILKPIASFFAYDDGRLYRKIKQIDWSEYLNNDKTFAINATTIGEAFTHSKYIALKTKDAIVDQFRENTGARPSVDTQHPDLVINLHINDRNCTLSLDSSGSPLFKRGYRQEQLEAPINEVLAAGMILLSGWDKKSDFMDPMCGSGTLPIEAALIAHNIAPGLHREFTFEKWGDFDTTLWKKIKQEAEQNAIDYQGSIIGFDIDRDAVKIARRNAQSAGMGKVIHFEQGDFLKSGPSLSDAMIMINPPYGERLEEQDKIMPFYKAIGDRLKFHYPGNIAWIISSNLPALKKMGLKPSRKIKLFNGKLECSFNQYEMYKGSKDDQKP